MRIPIENAVNGGESDCRNRTIHQMFLLIGLGERAGSGLPKIFSGWSSQHWSKPLLYEKQEPEQTLLELRMINLFDDSVINNLIDIYGDTFKKLDNTKRVILATAYLEKIVNHSRLNEIIDEHSHDISNILKQLVEDKFLNSDGIGRGKVYFLPTRSFNTPNDFTFESSDISNQGPDISNQGPDISNQGPDIISNLKMLDSDEIKILENISYEISITSRIQDKNKLEKVILEICSKKYISLTVLSQLLNRSSDSLRKHYLNPMVKNGDLIRAYETKPNHPNQAYKISK